MKKKIKNLKVQSNLPRKDSLGSGDRGTWPTIAGRCPLFRDQNKSECVRQETKTNKRTRLHKFEFPLQKLLLE